ncbi:MAG TPA: hypothetical protein VHS03_07870 [Gaiellaceae bacterium]|jgi:hypothetical protein|nr:hypothetical protein [Gaiellaceae bacterium]
MPEGLSPSEVGKEIREHAAHEAQHVSAELHRHDRLISIAEAVLLAIVALTAAWAGYSAAKWGTESSLTLAKASTTRAKANRAFQLASTTRAQDASNFNAWYVGYVAGNKNAERVAENRFRPNYDVAFRAWLATKPFTNPNAPKGPQYMPQYRPLGGARAVRLDAQADEYYAQGEHDAQTGDKYIRVTVILASVLFIVGISSHFPLRGIRIGLVCLGAGLLILAAVEILQLPGPPT